MSESEIIESLRKDFLIALPEKISQEELRQQLSAHINHLITHDFNQLVNYLYRIDVHEEKLKQLLTSYPDEEAGQIIAGLIIERQAEKIKSRKENKSNNIIPEDDKW